MSRKGGGVRARLRSLVGVVTLCALVATSGAAADDLKERLDTTRDDLTSAKRGLSAVQEQVGTAEDQLLAADRQLAALTDELRRQESELAAAEAAYAEATARTGDATRELRAVNAELERTEAELTEREDRFDDRIAAAYKYGNTTYARALIGADDVADFVNQMYYVRSVMDSDTRMIDDVAQTARQVSAARSRADALRDQLLGEEREAADLRARVEDAAAAQKRLTEMVANERSERANLLTTLEASEASYTELVDSLEAESNKLEQELKEQLEKQRFSGQTPGKGGLLWPADGRISSRYGYRTHPIYGTRRLHTGIDIAAPNGRPIIAVADGKVLSAGWRGGYGLAVVIDHGGGMATLYAHQSRLTVGAGEVVEQGQKIGEIGSTGNSTGNHVHFEVRINGEPRDPMGWY